MSWLSKVFYGVDLDEEQRRQDDLDAKLAALNQADYSPGGHIYNKIAEEQSAEKANETFEIVQEQQAAQLAQSGDVSAQVEEAFDEGLAEGAANIRRFLGAPFEKLLPNLAKAIPWQVWLAALAFLFFYLGGGIWLKRVLQRLFK